MGRRSTSPPFVDRFVDRTGRARFYFRPPGGERTALPGLPWSAEFMLAYAEARGGAAAAPPVAIGASRTVPGSVNAAIAAYYQAGAWTELADTSRANRRGYLERFRAEHGDKPFRKLEGHHVAALLAQLSPPLQKAWMTALRGLTAFAVEQKLIATDPTASVKRAKVTKSDGYRCWTEADVEAFEARWPIGSRERLALALALYTGARRGDLIRLGWPHVGRDGLIRWTPEKTKRSTGVRVELPPHPKLREVLDRVPRDRLLFVLNTRGQAYSPSAFSKWFGEAAKAAGLEEATAHGLRKTIVRRLVEAGAKPHQIMAVTGHSSLEEIERYGREFSRPQLGAGAIALLR
jgi:integrase